MSQIASKQVKRIISASIKVVGVSVTASSSSVVVTTPITSALAIAGDGGTAVPLSVSSGYNVAGVITNAPLNRSEVYDSTSKKKIPQLPTNNEIYARLTQASNIYTLSFFYLDNTGTEAPYIFSSNSTIDFDFNYRFEFQQLPSDALISQIARNIYQDAAGGSGSGVLQIEQLTVFSLNTLSQLANTPSDVNKVELIVNGQAVDALGGTSAAFKVTGGVNITWTAANAGYSLETTDRVIAKYFI